MKKSITERVAQFFNEGNLEGLVSLWDNNIKAYDLKTNELLVDSKETLMELDRPYVLDENVKFKINNVVCFDDVEIGHTSFEGFSHEQVQIFEIKNGLITRILITRIYHND